MINLKEINLKEEIFYFTINIIIWTVVIGMYECILTFSEISSVFNKLLITLLGTDLKTGYATEFVAFGKFMFILFAVFLIPFLLLKLYKAIEKYTPCIFLIGLKKQIEGLWGIFYHFSSMNIASILVLMIRYIIIEGLNSELLRIGLVTSMFTILMFFILICLKSVYLPWLLKKIE